MRITPRSTPPTAVSLLFCCLVAVSTSAAESSSSYRAALESIKSDELAEQVGKLADPAMEGREAGTRGGFAAGDHLVEQYRRLKFRGVGDNDGFFQSFEPNFRNVLAMLPGSDPKLKDQVIIVGAHYDHVGYGGRGYSIGPYGYVYPGADDNASGTSAALELAQAFTILAHPPKRSILFAHWDAEEKGLWGSKYFATHPTVPLDRVVAALNMDMLGRLRDKTVYVFGSRSGGGWRRLLADQNSDSGLTLQFPWTLRANADHWPLFDLGVPVLMFHTGLHNDYHRTSDVADRINSPGLAEVTRLIFGVVYELADRPATPAYRAAARHETPETEKAILDQVAPPPDRLGVAWIEDAARAGGIVVSNVVPGSPAARAGLQAGDCIVRFAGWAIQNDDDFYGIVSAAKNPVSMTVKRSGEPNTNTNTNRKTLELKVTLDGDPLRWGMVWRVDDAEPGTVILTHVVRGSPAARASLAPGDRIYQVGGRDFADESGFVRLVKTPSESLQLLVERDGRLRPVTVRLRRIEPLKQAA